MIIIIITHFLSIITNSDGQIEKDYYCTSQNPFRILDGACASFEYACYKTNDPQCDELRNACKYCPPSNITLNALKKILKNNEESFNLTHEIKIIVEKMSPISISVLILIIVILILIVLIIYLINKKHKLCGFIETCHRKKNKTFERNRLLTEKDKQDKNQKNLEELIDKNQKILEEIKKLMTQLRNKSTDIAFCTIQFQFDGIDQEPIELYVHNNHNIVQVKQQICAKLLHAKHDDYKIMKLKYNGKILDDDNQYLLENIDKSNAIVNCFIDSSMNVSDIVVVKLQGKMSLPDIIQINKNQSIDQLKELIGKMIDSKEFSLFKQSHESTKTEELKENLNNLKDGDWIRIVTKEFGKLVIKSIFDDGDSITIEYFNVDLVSSLMTSISNKFNWDSNNFVLFYNNKCLEADKYIFEYQISSESAVKYCFFMKWAGININEDYITKGNFSELRNGTLIKTNRKVLIKKYEVKSSKTWKDEEFMLKELITFQITKYHRRFIQLLGVYIDDTILYVVMENMDGGTLKTFLHDNYEKLDKNKIYKCSAQILEGLKFLHENKVIHRDLNPSSILVDGNEDLKLSSFNLSKYLDIAKTPASIMGKHDNKEELPVRYMAPEILNSGNYGEACDVWSFGAVLIRITTNKKPYSNSTKSEALNKISTMKMIEYKLPDKYSEFKSIIDSCLKHDPSQREKIKSLIHIGNI